MPSGGSASSSSPLAASIASSDPIRDRWTGWTAVTTPIRGRAIRASSAISPPTYIPISRTAASCSGPSRRSVSGRPTSLFWLPSLRSVRKRPARTAAMASLVEVLAMLPVTPTTSGSNRRRQPAASAPSAASGSATRMTVTSSSSRRVGDLAGRRRARPLPGDRVGEDRRAHRCARRAAPRTPRRVGPARESTAAPRMGRSDRARSRPPVRRTRSSAVKAGAGGCPGAGVDGSTSVTVASVAQAVRHRSGAVARVAGRRGRQQVGGGDRIGRDAPEELEGHHRHLEVADPERRSVSPPRSGSPRRGPGRRSGGRCSRRTSS